MPLFLLCLEGVLEGAEQVHHGRLYVHTLVPNDVLLGDEGLRNVLDGDLFESCNRSRTDGSPLLFADIF